MKAGVTTSILQGRNLGSERASSLLWVTQLFGDGSRRKGVSFLFFECLTLTLLAVSRPVHRRVDRLRGGE